MVRADSLDGLTARGWTTLAAHGVRTVIDLRNDDERGVDHAPRPAGIGTSAIPLDGIEHRDFWDVSWGTPGFATPAYFRPFLDRFPDRVAALARDAAHRLDPEAYLRAAGLTGAELGRLRGRLRGR
ncbi:tyrosine-protein phosphatase [Streptomyces sp. NPDC004667]|uniref:tyrosine-protein phosphatase n=1 Tax=Streptomyces sp. NPDC004667 TaxID=3154285 RepID=UPI0033A38415